MRNMKLNYATVGLFVVAMIGAVIATSLVLTGRTGASAPYHVVLDNVADIKYGTQVRYEGFAVGQVERISPQSDGPRVRFRVDVAVRKDWKIPGDSLARIGASSFLAAKTIDISAGTGATILAAGQEIPSAGSSDMFTMMSHLASEFSDLSKQSVQPLIDELGQLALRLGRSTEREVTTLLKSLNEVAGQVNARAGNIAATVESVTRRLDASGAHLQQILSDETVSSIARTLSGVEATSRNFAKTSADLMQTREKVDRLLEVVDGMARENRGRVDKSLTDVQYTLRTVAQNIDSILHNMDGTSRNMSEFSRLIRQDPSLLLGGAPREQIAPVRSRQ